MAPQPADRAASRTVAYPGRRHTPTTIVAGTVGNVMEWYDFALYGFFVPVISEVFFPASSQLGSLIATFGVFAAGFLMRPIGGVVFGYIGDRLGRAAVLRISVATMGAATLLLGVLPTAEQVGIWATVLLVAVRLLQGLSVGGEFSGSVTYMVETSPLHRRGLAGSWANVGSLAGTVLGSGLAALMSSLLSQSSLLAWGWRVPFWLGGAFGLAAFQYVRQLHKSPHMEHHERQHDEDSPLHEALTANLRETVLAVVFASGYGVVFYIPLVYLPTFASEVGSTDNDVALRINVIAIALAIPLVILSGWFSDNLVRRRTLLLAAFVLIAAGGWGFVAVSAHSGFALVAAQFLLAALVAVPMGVAPAMLVELFPVADRLTGYSLAYNLGLGVAGGTAPMVATSLISATGYDAAPGVYLSVAAIISATALALMQDRSREPLR